MPVGQPKDRWVMVERYDRMWSTGEGKGKPLQCSCLENPMNSMKRQNDRILKEEIPRQPDPKGHARAGGRPPGGWRRWDSGDYSAVT